MRREGREGESAYSKGARYWEGGNGVGSIRLYVYTWKSMLTRFFVLNSRLVYCDSHSLLCMSSRHLAYRLLLCSMFDWHLLC